MSVLNEMHATPHELVHNGKTYHVSLITQRIKVAFEKKLFNKAKEAALAMKELMESFEYQIHLKDLNDDYISGGYAMESPRGQKILQTTAGSLMLCSLLFGIDESEMLTLTAAKQDEVAAVLALVVHESFPNQEVGEVK